MALRVLGVYRTATANFATAGWRKVGWRRRRRIRRMARALYDHRPDVVVLTEVWREDVRQIIANNMPGYAFTHHEGSVVIAWRRATFPKLVKTWTEVAHPQVRVDGYLISDQRPIVHALLEDRHEHELHVDGTHLSPIRPKLGERAVIAGRAAQEHAFQILREHLGEGGRAKLLAGDMNNHGRFLGDQINGRAIDYAGSVTPDRMATVGTDTKDAELSNVRWIPLPGGDHIRRGRAVFLAATLTIAEAA